MKCFIQSEQHIPKLQYMQLKTVTLIIKMISADLVIRGKTHTIFTILHFRTRKSTEISYRHALTGQDLTTEMGCT